MRSVAVPRAEDLMNEPASMSLVRAGSYHGLGQDASYRLAKTGGFPCQVLKIGGRYRVTRAALAASLGVEIPGVSLAGGSDPLQASDSGVASES